MGTINTYTAYHATDKKNVKSILDNNFTFQKNKIHWLGFGAYFYLDVALAEQWAKNTPTEKFGKIEDPAIIRAIIEADSDHVTDLRNLDDYNYVKKSFDEYYKTVYAPGSKLSGDDSNKRLQCAFFNWYMKKTDTHCLIANFDIRNSLSEFTEHGNVFKQFHIPYLEVQMCVPRIDCIVARETFDMSLTKDIE